MSILNFYNAIHRNDWEWRWHLGGGSIHTRAKDMKDLRNEDDLRRGRTIEFQVAKLLGRPIRKKKVANLAEWRVNRARKRA